MRQAVMDVSLNDYAYGFSKLKHKSASSFAYEVSEDHPDSEYFSIYSTINPPEAFGTAYSLPSVSSTPSFTDSLSLISSDSDVSNAEGTFSTSMLKSTEDLPDLLNNVKTSIENLSKPKEKARKTPRVSCTPLKYFQSTPVKPPRTKLAIECYPKPLTEQGIVRNHARKHNVCADDKRTAQVVHDIVFEKYEKYCALLHKLRKINLSAEKNMFRKVIAELETMFEENSTNSWKILRNIAATKARKINGIPLSEPVPKIASMDCDNQKIFYKQFFSKAPSSNNNLSRVMRVETLTSPGNQPIGQSKAGRSTTNASSQANDQRSESSQAQNSDYDEQEFLYTALGEELHRGEYSEEYLFCPTASVNTADASALLSSRSTLTLGKLPKKRKTQKSISSIFTSLYYEPAPFENKRSFLQKSADLSTTPELVNEPFRYSYASYEDVTNLGLEVYSDEGKKMIKKHIFINETIAEQTEKMLNYGMRKSPGFIGSHAHLEGERILLVSKMRKQVLQSYLYRVPETTPEVSARVTIENLKCFLGSAENRQEEHRHRSYYMCILQHKTTIYSTRIAVPNKLDWVDLGGFFIFDNVSNTFNIKVHLYCVNIRKSNPMCLPLPFFKSASNLPMMALEGEACIGMLNIGNKKFTFKRSDNIQNKGHKLVVSIDASMNWPETLKGFLTIGREKMDSPPVWNRRWCVLEEATLKYYNYPSDENFCPPIGNVNLKTCIGCVRSEIRYLNKKTLRLSLDEYNQILLSPDTTKEYELWSRHFETILTIIKQWNFVKK